MGLTTIYLAYPLTEATRADLFMHELGHVFDLRHMNNRAARHVQSADRDRGEWWDYYWNPPGEMFADAYATCALRWD